MHIGGPEEAGLRVFLAHVFGRCCLRIHLSGIRFAAFAWAKTCRAGFVVGSKDCHVFAERFARCAGIYAVDPGRRDCIDERAFTDRSAIH